MRPVLVLLCCASDCAPKCTPAEAGCSDLVPAWTGSDTRSGYNVAMLTDEDKQWIANQIAASEERLSARIEKTETVLLTEFHKWASPVEMRQRTHAAALRAIDAEMKRDRSRQEARSQLSPYPRSVTLPS